VKEFKPVMRSRFGAMLCFFTGVCCLASPSFGQSSSPQAIGGIVIPVATGKLGQKDAAALTEATNHLAAVGTGWVGMQGTGTITYSTDTNAYAATLSNLGGDRFRLDAQTKNGGTSIRIHGLLGKIQGSDGKMEAIPADTAAVELFPFELPRVANFPGSSGSLVDHGLVNIGGTQLHRLTFETASIGRNPLTNSPQTAATDLYFDPT
jgi:hypothetical protein